jgi:hypothetical protein
MVAHVVLLEPRGDLSSEARRALVEAFRRAAEQIADVRGVRVGRRIVHGAGYEADVHGGAEYVVMIDFDDLDGLRRYLAHPLHVELGSRFGDAVASARVVDFETGGLDMLDRLVLDVSPECPGA